MGLLTFGAWGMGFNLATVSYFSLASEISGEHGRSKTTAVMFLLMIVSIIATAATLSRLLVDYTPARLQNAFFIVGLIALVMGLLGLYKLEPRVSAGAAERRYSLRTIFKEVRATPQVRLFFVYLMLMLAAVLGQDVLLEPFAARAFGMPIEVTTRITSLWGTCYLLSLMIAGFLEGRIPKVVLARLASWVGALAFALVAASGFIGGPPLFYTGVVMLGLATGPATVSNLSLMLDMTVPGKVGLFIGAWGSASAFARLLGSVVTALVRDLVQFIPNSAVTGYAVAFGMLGAFLIVSLAILRRINVNAFKHGAAQIEDAPGSLIERAALANDVS
jgi:BCD family chlorophyll transporter-like MFS transporter